MLKIKATVLLEAQEKTFRNQIFEKQLLDCTINYDVNVNRRHHRLLGEAHFFSCKQCFNNDYGLLLTRNRM